MSLQGLNNKIYPWGNLSVEEGIPKCNYWTGIFPTKNTKEDGFIGVAPVMQYQPNGYGLYDMAGNVAEWTSNAYDESSYSYTHDMNSVMEIGDNIVFIQDGEKIWTGNKKLFLKTQNKDLNNFIFSSKKYSFYVGVLSYLYSCVK